VSLTTADLPAVKETYGFPLTDVVSDRPDRVIVQRKQRIRDERKHSVRTEMRDVLRTKHGLNFQLRLRRQVEAQQRDRSGRRPACEEPHLVPLPSMPHTMRPMHCDLSIPAVSARVVIGDMGRERSLWLELIVRLLDSEAGPVRCRLISKTLTVLGTFASVTYCRTLLPPSCLARRRTRKSRLTGGTSYRRRTRESLACR
jgi:hypothetical protein